MEKFLECGKVINTHGVRGTVKMESLCDTPEILASLEKMYLLENGEYREYRVVSSSVQKRFVLTTFEGVCDVDAAEALRDRFFYADRDDMPLEDGDFFIADLIGLDVIDADSGKKYGTVSDVFNVGASDIYTVSTPDGERMIPAVPEFIIRVDLDEGIFVRPIEGMFD